MAQRCNIATFSSELPLCMEFGRKAQTSLAYAIVCTYPGWPPAESP